MDSVKTKYTSKVILAAHEKNTENDAKRYGLLLLRKPNIKEVRELFYCVPTSSLQTYRLK